MGSPSTGGYVPPTPTTGEPTHDVVEQTVTPVVDPVRVDPEEVNPEDIRILNWIGKFVKPMEERIVALEKQVQLLSSLTISPIEVEVKSRQ